jgi:DNA-binding Xre family transcriptional regulator
VRAGERAARRCRVLAQERGWDARKLAQNAEVSLAVATRALSLDAGQLRAGHLERIANAFGCPPEDLFLPVFGLGEK